MLRLKLRATLNLYIPGKYNVVNVSVCVADRFGAFEALHDEFQVFTLEFYSLKFTTYFSLDADIPIRHSCRILKCGKSERELSSVVITTT